MKQGGHRVALQGTHAARAERLEKREQEKAEAIRLEAERNKPPPIPKLDPETLDWSDGEEPDENYWLVKKGKYESEKDKKANAMAARAAQMSGEEPINPEEAKRQYIEESLQNPNQPSVVLPFTHRQDYKRSKLPLTGDTRDKLTRGVKGVLPREERKPNYSEYRFPLPALPAHVQLSLGLDIIEHLWHEFIMHGADASELVKLAKIKKIALKMDNHIGYKLYEFDLLVFPGLDKNDYVEFTAVCQQLALVAEKRNTRVQKIMSASINEKHPLMRLPLPACCAIDSCQVSTHSSGVGAGMVVGAGTGAGAQNKEDDKDTKKAENKRTILEGDESEEKGKDEAADGEGDGDDDDDDDDEVNVDLHALKISYVTFKLKQHGNLRLKHVPKVMEMASIPYDKSRYPSVEWDLRGELLVPTMDQCILIANMIRTDLDAHVSSETDPKYQLPRWMENEFKPSEIMLFKHHFKSIDVDGGGELDEEELQLLTESLGSKVTIEEAVEMIAVMDLDGGGTVSFDEFMMLMYKIQNGVIDLGDNLLAKSMMAAKGQIGIFEEIEENMSNPVPGTVVEHYGGSPVNCDFKITGPEGSPYEGGNFLLRVTFLDGYPYKKPDVVFITRIFHVNVVLQFDGQGYMPHIESLWDSSWNIRKVVEHIQELLATPQPDYIPIDMVHIVKVFLSEKLSAAQEFERQRRQDIAEAKAERLAWEAQLAEEAAEAAEFLRHEEESNANEIKIMSGEDPLYNEQECEAMGKCDINMAAILSMDEEDELNVFMEGYRVYYANIKAEEEEEARIAAEEKAKEDELERIRLDLEEQAEIDAGQDPTLALLEGLVGNNNDEEDLSHIDPKYRKVVVHKTSDELMETMGRQQQMHLATIQMFLFENERYSQAVMGYVEKFAKVYAAQVAFDEDEDADADADADATAQKGEEKEEVEGDDTVKKMASSEYKKQDHTTLAHTHSQEHKATTNEVVENGTMHVKHDEDEHEDGDDPSLFYRNGRRKKNPEIDDESSESDGEDGEGGAAFD